MKLKDILKYNEIYTKMQIEKDITEQSLKHMASIIYDYKNNYKDKIPLASDNSKFYKWICKIDRADGKSITPDCENCLFHMSKYKNDTRCSLSLYCLEIEKPNSDPDRDVAAGINAFRLNFANLYIELFKYLYYMYYGEEYEEM